MRKSNPSSSRRSPRLLRTGALSAAAAGSARVSSNRRVEFQLVSEIQTSVPLPPPPAT